MNDSPRQIVRAGAPGVRTMEAVAGLLRAHDSDAAADLETLADRLGGSPGAIARAAGYLVSDRVTDLITAAKADPLLSRHSPQAYWHLRTVPPDAPLLFSLWLDDLQRSNAMLGVTAFRAYLGDVSEAAFRAIQHGASADALLGDSGRTYLVDAICAELGGTTDFLAARGMVWLIGALAPGDDAARAAIERASGRFRDPSFQSDCAAILDGEKWPG
jgi:hypothetical protein